MTYEYDYNGNLIKDLNTKITDIQYNYLNLPASIQFEDGSRVSYLYYADGKKLRVTHVIGGTTTTTDYCGKVVYENGSPKTLLTESGFISLKDGRYHYYLQDHQGNNRVVADQNGTIEEVNHYYPFGGIFESTSSVQPYKYNGKELDRSKGLDWYDYGARMYDPALGRWNAVDPKAEKYYAMSPYNYCLNNPMRFVDPTGMDPEEDSEEDNEKDPKKDPRKQSRSGLKKYTDLFFGYLLYQMGMHPDQRFSENRAVQEDAQQRTEKTIEALHTTNETLLSLVPGGEFAYKGLNDREISGSDYGWAAAEFIPFTKVGGKAARGASIWTKTKEFNSIESAFRHWKKHGSDFPQFQNAKQYVEGTKNFLHNSPSGTLIKIRPDGDVLKYHPATNTFGVMDATGAPRTMFKPVRGMEYWHKQ